MDDLLLHPAFSDLDRHFARFVARFGGGETVVLAALCLSRAVRQGHICLDLTAAPGDPELAGRTWPTPEQWRRELGRSKAVESSPEPGGDGCAPLILDGAGRLYLRRYYRYERSLAAALRDKAGRVDDAAPLADAARGQEDRQAAAVETALRRRLTVISGGPGTGKTTTVVRVLAALLARAGVNPLRIALSAPTGKAAARLEEAVRKGVHEVPGLSPAQGDALAAQVARIPRARTLDRLLGSRPGTVQLRHHAENPLPLDALVVDEASMVALPLMAKLFAALPSNARVILLGDRDQLASVAPGSVLADLADAALDPGGPLGGAIVTLTKNFRFGNESAIFRLCQAIREGEAAPALALVSDQTRDDLASHPLPPPPALEANLRDPVITGYAPYLAERDPLRALEAFAGFRILSALRRGPYGVEELNRRIEAILREAKLIAGRRRLYAGLPVLITRNDYQVGLFNGDIGILLPDPADPEPPDGAEKPLWAWFPGEGDAAVRRVSPARLPDYEPAYAMTVHKSQGSEFGRVLLVLPDRDTPVLTRELIYTGLTRAKTRVELWFEPGVFERGVARRAERASGLRDALL